MEGRKKMKIKIIFGLLVRLIISVIFAGVFYTGWMAVAIPTLRSGPMLAKAVCWLIAPVVTGGGFAAGLAVFELLPATRKSKFRDILLWPICGCAVGAVAVFPFGPMLIVFAMFGLGAASVLAKEVVSIKKQNATRE